MKLAFRSVIGSALPLAMLFTFCGGVRRLQAQIIFPYVLNSTGDGGNSVRGGTAFNDATDHGQGTLNVTNRSCALAFVTFFSIYRIAE